MGIYGSAQIRVMKPVHGPTLLSNVTRGYGETRDKLAKKRYVTLERPSYSLGLWLG